MVRHSAGEELRSAHRLNLLVVCHAVELLSCEGEALGLLTFFEEANLAADTLSGVLVVCVGDGGCTVSKQRKV